MNELLCSEFPKVEEEMKKLLDDAKQRRQKLGPSLATEEERRQAFDAEIDDVVSSL